jgi:hypothetical protein
MKGPFPDPDEVPRVSGLQFAVARFGEAELLLPSFAPAHINCRRRGELQVMCVEAQYPQQSRKPMEIAVDHLLEAVDTSNPPVLEPRRIEKPHADQHIDRRDDPATQEKHFDSPDDAWVEGIVAIIIDTHCW